MKIIFSRKGFDSSAGGIPSPILPDGQLLPLPVPQPDGPVRFSDLRVEGRTLSSMIKQLGGRCWRGRCHLDPDLDAGLMTRPEGWLPAFGQYGSAQRHLEQEGVGTGDLFLFFGWFRQTEWVKGRLQFVSGAPDLHILHSWLQVGEVCPVDENLVGRWPGLVQHPHLLKDYPFNTLYLPSEQLVVDNQSLATGSGMFGHWRPELQLTVPGELRSIWRLPDCFSPQASVSVLSYHRNPERWRSLEEGVQLSAVYRGQEFVVESARKEQVSEWLSETLFKPDSRNGRF